MSTQLAHEGTQVTHDGSQAKTVALAGRGWLRGTWYRMRFTVAEMNYAARRVVEVRAPWIVDEHGHGR
jgi:hypothetical protein